MTDQETIKQLKNQVKRLRKRLLEKMEYETGYLQATSTTPQLIEKIRRKDEAALRED